MQLARSVLSVQTAEVCLGASVRVGPHFFLYRVRREYRCREVQTHPSHVCLSEFSRCRDEASHEGSLPKAWKRVGHIAPVRLPAAIRFDFVSSLSLP